MMKEVFRLAFYSKLKCCVLIDHIISETICFSCFPVSIPCSQVFTIKLNLRQNIGLHSKLDFLEMFF